MKEAHYDGAIEFARRLMESRDLFTHIHQNQTAELTVAIARHFTSDESLLLACAQGARLHDIGKLLLPMDLLTKPGRISEMEFRYLQHHVEYGCHVVEPLRLPEEVIDIIGMHHERMDGSGYPRGLKNGAIPMYARIAGVADMTEAMMADRPYRRSLGLPRVMEILSAERGIKLDGDVVDALHEVIKTKSVEWLN